MMLDVCLKKGLDGELEMGNLFRFGMIDGF